MSYRKLYNRVCVCVCVDVYSFISPFLNISLKFIFIYASSATLTFFKLKKSLCCK